MPPSATERLKAIVAGEGREEDWLMALSFPKHAAGRGITF